MTLLQQALEALKNSLAVGANPTECFARHESAITALRAAIDAGMVVQQGRSDKLNEAIAALRAQPDHSELIAKIERQERVMREALEALKLEMTQGPLIKECHNAIAAIEKELGE